MIDKKFPSQNVLVVDDEESVRFTLKLTLKKICKVFEAANQSDCLSIIIHDKIDIVLLDVGLPDINGIELLTEIKKYDSTIEVIMVTALDDYETAIKAIKFGAYDYITKPFNTDEFQNLVIRVLERKMLVDENKFLKHELAKNSVHKNIIAKDKVMIELLKKADKVAKSNSPVLIYGESGSGKEVFARFMHEQSDRAQMPFIPINCGGIPENLLESELFGYEKGAFTGAVTTKPGKLEIAAGGTVFLDEIGNMPITMQVKLLRALQELQVERIGSNRLIPIDVRIISATNIVLDEAIKNNLFREDLYFRLNVVSFKLPALRERRADIKVLLDYYIDYYSVKFKKQKIVISSTVKGYLEKYEWPGNVRELKNLIESFYALYGGGDEISFSYLPVEMLVKNIDENNKVNLKNINNLSLKEAVSEFEKDYIKKVLNLCEGNQGKTADFLKIHRNTLLLKVNQYNILK
ncbi:MAG: hypothetical protein DKM50_02460 [Candidatus Margulisiibacteriota bacterium]|nr:MAG: hypothetical protein A2X43_03760 [Candidatus Margulisbacteria bacterium GWD2_39_127]OGI02470.1 MAG: hypothetical protein A2X42_07285 [Candidatus Margulisbacteria bacterium GWF2_38_17]OGI10963.1 MAG: hypothetical protein A2X41_01810 [Candidatus Margulisbacteria bacterium GWE2_39_32]PZM83158.1 MAG: hypothetical protein DKM50_02460 [Candidatus Margulisiibacteriota bacterium]HAR62541.1 hypothetical protein [Candidatus Margulisiibacteriota bacterium]